MKKRNKGRWTLYIHKNKINEKVYVGITSRNPEKRWGNKGNGYKPDKASDKPTHFWMAIQKYGWDSFEHQIIITGLFKDEAELLEQQYIQMFDSYNNGYNSNLGGSTGSMGYRHTENAKKNMKLKRIGRKHTEEWNKRISESQRCKRPVICLETGEIYDSPLDCANELKTYKQGILDACRGVAHTFHGLHFQFADEQYKTIEQIELERKDDPRKRKIVCMETGEVFGSIKECAEKTGNDRRNIDNSLKRHRSVKGFHYKYIEDNITLDEIKENHNKKCSNQVRCVETGEIFPSITECAKHFNTSSGNINTVCKGNKTYHTIRGYHLEFVDYKPRIRKIICITTGEVFNTQKELAQRLNVSSSTIGDILTYQNGERNGMIYKYYDDKEDGVNICQ